MSRFSSKHNLEDSSLLIRCSRQSIQQKANVKLLGVIFDQHLTWIDQINNIIRSTHGTLRVLRKFSRFTPMKVRKTLAEALILSKINYCNVVYGQLPKYLINRFQRVQNTTAGYVYGQYAKTLDVINLNWPPIEENIEMNTVKLAHKSLNDKLWPDYLKLALTERKKILRLSNLGPIIKQGDDYTVQQQATFYNNVPKKFKEINNFKAFSRKTKGFYKDKALARVLPCPTTQLLWIAATCCFSRFSFDFVLYFSHRPLILLNFFSNGQLIYILFFLVSHVYLSQFQC